jgi:hypothetical protein
MIIRKLELILNPSIAPAVKIILITVVFAAPNFLVILSLKRLESTVPAATIADTIPAYDTGTPSSTNIVGHADPSAESGSPKLTKHRYKIARRSVTMFFLIIDNRYLFLNVVNNVYTIKA